MARPEQHREDVVPVAGVGAAVVDQLEHEPVRLGLAALEIGERADAPEHLRGAPLRVGWHEADRPVAEGEHLGEPVAQSVEPRAGIEAEHRAQDDLEREPLHPRLQRDLAVARPALHLAPGHLRHQVAEPGHALSVEGREEQPALLHMGSLVEQDHRVLAHERLEHARALARVEDVGRRREHLADLVRPGEDHEPRGQREVDREAVPVPGAQPLKEGERARPQAHALHERGEARSGRELLRGHGGALTGGYWAAIACAIAS